MTTDIITTGCDDDYIFMEEGSTTEYGAIDDRARVIEPIKPFSTKAFSKPMFDHDSKIRERENKKLPPSQRDYTVSDLWKEIASKTKFLKNEETSLVNYVNCGVLTKVPDQRTDNDDIYFTFGEFIASVTVADHRSSVIREYCNIFRVLYNQIIGNYCRNIERWIREGDMTELTYASKNLVKLHIKPFIEKISNIEYFKDTLENNISVQRILNLLFINVIKYFNKYDLKSFELNTNEGAPIWNEIQIEWHHRMFGIEKIKDYIESLENLRVSGSWSPERQALKNIEADEKRDDRIKKIKCFLPCSDTIENNSQFPLVNATKRLGFKEKDEVKAIIGCSLDDSLLDNQSADMQVVRHRSGITREFEKIKYNDDIDRAIRDVDSKHYREDEALLTSDRSKYNSTPDNFTDDKSWWSYLNPFSSCYKKKTNQEVVSGRRYAAVGGMLAAGVILASSDAGRQLMEDSGMVLQNVVVYSGNVIQTVKESMNQMEKSSYSRPVTDFSY